MSARLGDLTPGVQVTGVRNDGPVEVDAVEWFEANAIGLTLKAFQGKPGNALLYRTDEARLKIQTTGLAWSFDA